MLEGVRSGAPYRASFQTENGSASGSHDYLLKHRGCLAGISITFDLEGRAAVQTCEAFRSTGHYEDSYWTIVP
jgi:hypothetical protein